MRPGSNSVAGRRASGIGIDGKEVNEIKKVWLLTVVLFLALFLASCGGGGGKQTPAGTNAPSFKAVDLATGKAVTVPEAYRGRALALLFFSPG